ncbi:hypothetical protein BXY85_0325 [Roseivirga pacifica]|jgi:phage protein U|uniref:Uncharacterized protein n=1 Tax=Roseivirga pacifica TaxID=1267423 RepID=A0A1I0RBN4_9BACT|nr:hypothetical protein [Roseivirga pacifica]MCO6358031.1 hypothetical protein [Roseivirga pacifica]MCO6366469.1 hypothetical protein [Roseivirga pacifica]MCO6370954.1 hypothetical protein [Roseivirga pacifica]MCO6373762.1 hypothetical protein [Roseivirga pacifica]MCO6380743.1 hypothetical protein [Roseivirga pacifica]
MFTQPTLYLGAMNGQHKITISGVVFYVEDCCQKQLLNHLAAMNNFRKDMPLDERVAEVLLDELKAVGKDVISGVEVEHLIQRTKHLRQPD